MLLNYRSPTTRPVLTVPLLPHSLTWPLLPVQGVTANGLRSQSLQKRYNCDKAVAIGKQENFQLVAQQLVRNMIGIENAGTDM